MSEETLKVFINLTQPAPTVLKTNRALSQAQPSPRGCPQAAMRWLSLPAWGSFSHKLGPAILSVHLSVFGFPDVPSQPSDEGRAVGIWLEGGHLGKCLPKCKSVRVPVLICIGEGPSRLGRRCEGPSVIPLEGLLQSVISQESMSFLEFD